MDIDNYQKVKQEVLWVASVSAVVILLLNGLVAARYAPLFDGSVTNYHQLIRDNFQISGFDAWTYSVLTEWNGWEINAMRHPLYSLLLYPLFLLNQGLMAITGTNCAVYIVAALNTVVGTASLSLLYLVLRRVVGVGRWDSGLLVAMFFSFAYVMLTMMVPDHFNLSLLLLLLTLYVAGRHLQRHTPMGVKETVGLLVATGGVSLNNGIKVVLAALCSRGRQFFRLRYLALAVVLPLALLYGVATVQYQLWGAPRDRALKHKVAMEQKAFRDSIRTAYIAEHPREDSAAVAQGVKKILKRKAWEQYVRNHRNPKVGKPISREGYFAWTDITTSRWQSGVENLFGESFQLHRPHLLEDLMTTSRPMIVQYDRWWHYAVVGVIFMLFVVGMVYGLRERFFQMVALWYVLDMLVFFVLGFAINEIYIMTSGWAFIIPIGLGYALKRSGALMSRGLMVCIGLLTLYLLVYNGGLVVEHLYIL